MGAASFWEKVQKGPPSDCWPWMRARVPRGYGRVWFEGRLWIASRVAYRLHYGVDPGAMCVLHRCDNPPCCNPDHLFLGTQGDNLADCRAKGRYRQGTPHGERNAAAVLTEAQVAEMRAAYVGGIGIKALALRYGVSRASVKRAIAGSGWSHVPGAVPLGRVVAEKTARREAAVALFHQGFSAREVAAAVGITMSGAYSLKSRHINQARAA